MNKEMIKTLIDDGWEWVARDKNEIAYVYSVMPCLEERNKRTFVVKTENENDWNGIPSCLFPDIKFENSPVELKTLLIDDFEHSEEQEFIRSMLSIDKEAYLLKEFDSSVFEDNEDDVALWCKEKSGLHFYDAQKLKSYFPKEIHEKVYLKDLVKKRKVKKSVWLAVDENGVVRVANEKPIRGCNGIWVDERGYAVHDMSKHTNLLPLSWEDEPIELTYEVEE